jgi:hypothetical protein
MLDCPARMKTLSGFASALAAETPIAKKPATSAVIVFVLTVLFL